MIDVRDDAEITNETWIHQLARRSKRVAPVKVLLDLAAVGPPSHPSFITGVFSVPQVEALRKAGELVSLATILERHFT
jgi:hypothetical protein